MLFFHHKFNREVIHMNATIVKEATDILKRLSPENQAYFMTLVRVAEAAEKGARSAAEKHLCEPSGSNVEP